MTYLFASPRIFLMVLFRRTFFLLLLLLTTASLAHEFWLQPVRFVVAPGTRVHIGRWVGQNFSGERWPGKSVRLEQLLHRQPGGQVADLTSTAKQADSLQTSVLLEQPGTHVLAFRTNEAQMNMQAAEFNAYLQEEGLEYVQELRRKRKQTDKPAREMYRRCAKTLLLAGTFSVSDSAYYQPLGHPLEILTEQNPYTLRTGASLTVRVLADGKPVMGQLLQAWIRPSDGSSLQHFQLHTNNNGRALLRLQQPATVLLATVRMVPHPVPATADWQSTWASLTFAFSGR
jgi:uncharacterized GH25 family protein